MKIFKFFYVEALAIDIFLAAKLAAEAGAAGVT